MAFGVEEALIDRLLDDTDSTPWRRVCARKLTLELSKMVEAYAQAVPEAGWSERDFHHALSTICLFNLVNRLLEGRGSKGQDHLYKERGAALARDGYAPLLAHLPAACGVQGGTQPK